MTPRNPWNRRRRPGTVFWLTISILVTSSLLCTWIAHAAPETPQQDGRFLFSLGEHGISYGDATQVIVAGHEVCNLLDAGAGIELVVSTLDRTTQLGRRGAMVFAAISIANFCGWQGDALRPHKGGPGQRNVGAIL